MVVVMVVEGTGQRGLAGNLACLPNSVGSSLSSKPSRFWVPRAPEKTLAGGMRDNSSRRWKLGGHWRAQRVWFLGSVQLLYCSKDDCRNIPGDRQDCLLLSPPLCHLRQQQYQHWGLSRGLVGPLWVLELLT